MSRLAAALGHPASLSAYEAQFSVDDARSFRSITVARLKGCIVFAIRRAVVSRSGAIRRCVAEPNLDRVHSSPLSGPERVALNWLVRRLPARMTPDMLTAFGTFGALLVFVGYLLSWRTPAYLWLATAGLAIHWFGDSLDGSLARYRRAESPRYGFFIDQCIDVPGNLLICAGLGLSPFVRLDVALLALAGYHALTILGLVRTTLDREFHVTVMSFGPTEVRACLILLNGLMLLCGKVEFAVLGYALSPWDGLVGLFAASSWLFFGLLMLSLAPRYRREDRLASLVGGESGFVVHARAPQDSPLSRPKDRRVETVQ
jgi:archaetidylinositol phosphate synthase